MADRFALLLRLEAAAAQLHIEYPMLFQLENRRDGRRSHCGVLEFIADEGMVYLPYWMMQNLLLSEGDVVTLRSASLPKGTYVKLQPHSSDFLDISNPRAVLETTMRNFACLTGARWSPALPGLRAGGGGISAGMPALLGGQAGGEVSTPGYCGCTGAALCVVRCHARMDWRHSHGAADGAGCCWRVNASQAAAAASRPAAWLAAKPLPMNLAFKHGPVPAAILPAGLQH